MTLRETLEGLDDNMRINDGASTWDAPNLLDALGPELDREVYFEGPPAPGETSQITYIGDDGYQQSPAAFVVEHPTR